MIMTIVSLVEAFHGKRHQHLPVSSFVPCKGGFVLIGTQLKLNAALRHQSFGIFNNLWELPILLCKQRLWHHKFIRFSLLTGFKLAEDRVLVHCSQKPMNVITQLTSDGHWLQDNEFMKVRFKTTGSDPVYISGSYADELILSEKGRLRIVLVDSFLSFKWVNNEDMLKLGGPVA